MKNLIQRTLYLVTLVLSLNACSTFFDKDNTPPPSKLTDFITEAKVRSLWYTHPGVGSDNDLKLAPAISNQSIFTANRNGVVIASHLTTGKTIWQSTAGGFISGGVSVYGNAVYVGTQNGEFFAFDQTNGQLLWKATLPSEALAPAAANGNVVLVKTIDGHVSALSTMDGHLLWKHQQTEPTLVLRGSSAPQITHDSTIVGFENGELIKLSLHNGKVQWERSIAEPKGLFAIQRMIDIDADPIVLGNRVYAATYQGHIAALTSSTGEELWNHDISSYAGIAADGNQVYVSDAASHVWAFNAAHGSVNWEQTKLAARTITGPALINNYIVVGDGEGYLHWMNKQDGRFIARTFVNKSGIIATPIVNNNIVYVYTKDGHLAAYTIGA